MQDFRPEVFGRVTVAAVAGVGELLPVAERVDLAALRHPRMVLPQDEHRIRFLLESGGQGEGRQVFIRQAGRAGRRIDRNAPDTLRLRAFPDHIPQHRLQHFQIILRMLAEAVRRGIAVPSLRPPRIGFRPGRNDASVPGIHQDGPGRIRPVIHTDHIVLFHKTKIVLSPEKPLRKAGSIDIFSRLVGFVVSIRVGSPDPGMRPVVLIHISFVFVLPRIVAPLIPQQVRKQAADMAGIHRDAPDERTIRNGPGPEGSAVPGVSFMPPSQEKRAARAEKSAARRIRKRVSKDFMDTGFCYVTKIGKRHD